MTIYQVDDYFLGAMDWQHPEWVGLFYPADMPDDWQLTYYNTQFSCVWIPYARWGRAEIEAVRQWREDTHARFRFVLERPPILAEKDRAVQQVLGDRIGRLCTEEDESLIWFDAKIDLKLLTGLIKGRDRNAPTYLLSRDADLATLEKIGTLLGLLGL